MKTIEITEVSALVPLLQAGGSEPLFVTQNGATVAAIVPTQEQDVESLLLSVNPHFQEILERSQERFDTEGGLTSDDVRKRLGLPPKE